MDFAGSRAFTKEPTEFSCNKDPSWHALWQPDLPGAAHSGQAGQPGAPAAAESNYARAGGASGCTVKRSHVSLPASMVSGSRNLP